MIHADSLIDRIKLKAQVTRWRILTIVVAVMAIVLMIEKSSSVGGGPIRGNYIARITIDSIVEDDPELTKLIKEVKEDSYAKAVIVRIDSPGGSAVGGQQIYLDLRDLAKEKPVVSTMRSIAASAAYMLALGSDRIYAREGTITGSIGVIMETAEVTDLAQKLGIKPIVFKTGEFKASPSPIEKLTDRQAAVMQTVISDFYDWFVGVVAERRGLSKETVIKLADGRIYSGRQALENKLIDGLGGEAEALQWLEKNKQIDASLEVEDVSLKPQKSGLFEEISQSVHNMFLTKTHLGLDGMLAIWQP